MEACGPTYGIAWRWLVKRQYRVYRGKESVDVGVDGGPQTWDFTLDDQSGTVRLSFVEPQIALLQFEDGRVVEVPYALRKGKMLLNVAGHSYEFEVLDRLQALLREHRGGTAGGDGALTVAMPGRVIKIVVAEGDVVAAGDGVVIVEAMKMENELKAPVSGTIERIAVAVGDTVEAGDLLLQIDPED
ncbi:MAG: biotin/lipoyl-binding protein [Candidatus Dadabacteria bacterium]|nr:MAG: biotin/lipoyl-binding protein [Candidatus Dadabacteria bacterium]